MAPILKRTTIAVFLALLCLPMASVSQPRQISISLNDIAEADGATPGRTFRVALEARLETSR